MKIRCKECGRIEEANVALFVNIIGGALPAGGFWAWTAYFFAGTGFALPIVIAMISGGVGILVYKEEIVSGSQIKAIFVRPVTAKIGSLLFKDAEGNGSRKGFRGGPLCDRSDRYSLSSRSIPI